MSDTVNYIEAFGALPETVDLRDYRLKASAVQGEFPESFELKPCSVKNQGSVGSCVAHALAEVVEYHNKVQNNSNKKASVGFIYGNRRNSKSKTAGMYVREALANMVDYGDAYYTDFPENKEVPDILDLFENRFESLKDSAYPHRFSTYIRLTSDDEIKYALMNYGPVVFAMNWYSDLKVDIHGIVQTDQDMSKYRGGHCMMIYGWNKNGWKIQNSWGTLWGQGGRATLPYDIKRYETWAVTDNVIEGDLKKPFKSKLLQWLVKIFNFILTKLKLKTGI